MKVITSSYGFLNEAGKFISLESAHIREDGTLKWAKSDTGESQRPEWLKRSNIITEKDGKETIKDDKGNTLEVRTDAKDPKRKVVRIGKVDFYF